MVSLPSFDAADVARLVSMPAAIDALRSSFAATPCHIARGAHAIAGGELLVMPAVDDATGSAGVKLLIVQPANASRGEPTIQGMYVLFDAEHGRPVAILDGAALTRLRTPAASAIATHALARDDATTLGIVGSGPQAHAHIDAVLCVRPSVERVVVANRTPAGAAAVVATIDDPRRSVVTGSITEAAACDIVCLATRSTEPIVSAGMVRPGAHVNAVGSYRADMCELSPDLLAASTVTVDEIDAAREEAGDLVLAVASGEWSWAEVAGDLTTISRGATRRSSEHEITVFKSVGLAVEDLIVARLVAAAAGLVPR